MGAAALPSLWATITGTTATAAGAAGAGAAGAAGAGVAGAGAAGAAGAGAAGSLGTLAATNTYVAPALGKLATTAATTATKGIGSKLATAALTGAAGALAADKLAPKMPAATAPPGPATVDASAQAARARNRAREAIFGGRRGTLLTSGSAAEGFNTGRKKLLGQ